MVIFVDPCGPAKAKKKFLFKIDKHDHHARIVMAVTDFLLQLQVTHSPILQLTGKSD